MSFSASPAFYFANNAQTSTTSLPTTPETPWYGASTRSFSLTGDTASAFNGGRFNNSKTEQKLMEHIRNRDMRGIEKSIAYGASVQTSAYKSDPPILVAIDCGYKDITKLLLEHKQLDINERARNGLTPLVYAAMLGKGEIVSTLLKEKATIDLPDCHGDTALIKAVANGNQNIVDLLMKKGADVNVQNNSGNAAIHVAVMKSNTNIMRSLLKSKKINRTLENKHQQSAIDLLVQFPNPDIKDLLVQK